MSYIRSSKIITISSCNCVIIRVQHALCWKIKRCEVVCVPVVVRVVWSCHVHCVVDTAWASYSIVGMRVSFSVPFPVMLQGICYTNIDLLASLLLYLPSGVLPYGTCYLVGALLYYCSISAHWMLCLRMAGGGSWCRTDVTCRAGMAVYRCCFWIAAFFAILGFQFCYLACG